MDSIKRRLEQFEARSRRERLLLLVATLAVLMMLSYLAWIGPRLSERRHWLEQICQAEQESARILAQSNRLETVLQADRDQENEQRLNQLEAVSERLDQELTEVQAGMISPERVPEVLQDMLKELPLVLLSLRKLPAEIEIDPGVEGVPKIYRHGLRLELEGSYADTLDYIERLEGLPWGLAWEALDIRMQRYPRAHIILHLYTLSLKEEWLGV